MPSVSTTRDIVCASHFPVNLTVGPFFVAFFMDTGDFKYIKFERKGGDKKKVGPKTCKRLENIYLNNEDNSSIYIDFHTSFRSSNSLVLQYIRIYHTQVKKKKGYPVFENVPNKPRKVRNCAHN